MRRPLRAIFKYQSNKPDEESESLFLPILTNESLKDIKGQRNQNKAMLLLQGAAQGYQNILAKEYSVPTIPSSNGKVLSQPLPKFPKAKLLSPSIFAEQNAQELEVPLCINSLKKTICRKLTKDNKLPEVEVKEVEIAKRNLIQSNSIDINIKPLRVDEDLNEEKAILFFSPYSRVLEKPFLTSTPPTSLLAFLTTKLLMNKTIPFNNNEKTERFDKIEFTKVETKM